MAYQELWSDLPKNIRLQFETNSMSLEVKRGQHVYHQGDQPKGIYFVQEGLIGLTLLGSSGKEHLLRFFKEKQFFGHRSLFSDEDYHSSAIALEPTKLKLVPKKVILDSLKTSPELLLRVVEVLARELRRCENQHVLILDNQIHVRVAQALIYLKNLHPNHQWTRQEIANFCASTVSTVIKALADLEKLGLIEQKGRSINILQKGKLVSLQDEDEVKK